MALWCCIFTFIHGNPWICSSGCKIHFCKVSKAAFILAYSLSHLLVVSSFFHYILHLISFYTASFLRFVYLLRNKKWSKWHKYCLNTTFMINYHKNSKNKNFTKMLRTMTVLFSLYTIVMIYVLMSLRFVISCHQ